MRQFSASDLLDLWERGIGNPPAEQALLLLRVAFPDAPHAALAGLTIGQRDLCLLKMRELTFGTRLTGLAVCPDCGEHVELDFDSRELRGEDVPLPDPETVESAPPDHLLTLPGWELHFRLPTTADALSLPSDASKAQVKLLEGCLISASHEGSPVQPAELPAEVIASISEQMSQADPFLNITLALKCPACDRQWQMIFDIVTYLWSEVSTWAVRLMREVHHLASAYGWREEDILSMSAWRRQRYLEMIGVA